MNHKRAFVRLVQLCSWLFYLGACARWLYWNLPDSFFIVMNAVKPTEIIVTSIFASVILNLFAFLILSFLYAFLYNERTSGLGRFNLEEIRPRPMKGEPQPPKTRYGTP